MNTDDDGAAEPKRGRPPKRKNATDRGGCEAGVSSSTDAKKEKHSVSCASWQYDANAQPHLRLQTKAVRDDLLKRLMSQDHYATCGDEMVRNNGDVVKVLKEMTLSQSRAKAMRDEGLSLDLDTSRHPFFELVVSMLGRLHSPKLCCFFCICLSLMALKCSVNKQFWSLLVTLRILYEYNFTHELATELGEMAREPQQAVMKSMCVAIGDNKAFYKRANACHVEPPEDASGRDSQTRRHFLIETVQLIYAPVSRHLGLCEIEDCK
jgi:hypothetical protein